MSGTTIDQAKPVASPSCKKVWKKSARKTLKGLAWSRTRGIVGGQ